MASPAPTPYQPGAYDTDSAGSFFGTPIVELLHDYYHAGSDDYDTNTDYAISVAGFIASIVIIGVLSLLCVWCFNLCACCKCCREGCCSPCFGVFGHNKMRGKGTVIVLFLITAVVAMTSYAGRNEFNDAIYQTGDELRYLGDTFDALEATSADMVTQAGATSTATDASACNDATTATALEGAADGLVGATDAVYGLLEGLGGELRKVADQIEADFPSRVDTGMAFITVMIWVNVLLGICAICTDKCKCDDCLVILIGTLTLVTLIIVVALEVALAVTLSDFCYKGPENAILESVGGGE